MKLLKAVKPNPSDSEGLEKEVLKTMKELYRFVLGKKRISNSQDALEEAINSGRVFYFNGAFRGKFNKSISAILKDLGARWNIKDASWRLPHQLIPAHIGAAITQAEFRNVADIEELNRRLQDAKLPPKDFSKAIKSNLDYYNGQISATLHNVQVVQPKFSEEQKEQIIKKYSDNMKLNIQKWETSEISRLRKIVEEQVKKGIRYSDLTEIIMKEFDAPIKKAKFLAEQETHLLVAEMKEQQYRKAGINQYQWHTRNEPTGHNKGNVRPDHASLDGKIFDWDHPPVVDQKTGRRAHPGQDFRCRCVAIPVYKKSQSE